MRQHHQRSSDTAISPSRADEGFSLVETLVAMVLISVAVVPLMLAGITSIRVSAQTRTIAKVESVLSNAADRVNRATAGCGNYDQFVQAAPLSQGWAADRATATYAYYTPAANSPTVEGTWTTGLCAGTTRPDGLVQKVTITVTSPDNKVQRTIVVVKSDV